MDMKTQIRELVTQMTVEEKARLCSGADFWHMQGNRELGIPEVMVTDGPHGLRKQAGASDHLGLNKSVLATCFPAACTTACSWDPQVLCGQGRAMGEECVQEEVAVILGPGVNIKRSPLCGRNFEYFSEDPLLSGEMAAGMINGVQSQGIGTSLKHYAGNNQEKARLISNSIIDERTLNEIYLSAFERAVKKAQPWTVMCSYNKINGVYSCENPWLLDEKLRREWGFQGIVMTDWGAMNDRVEALKAGLELEMPGASDWNDQKLVTAVKEGRLPEAVLDHAVEKLLELTFRAVEVEKRPYDVESHHKAAREVAANSMVLLKNDGMLPLSKEKRYAVLGAFAKTPRYQGAGSSKIAPHRIDSPLDELRALGISCEYAPGYDVETGAACEALLREARECAGNADGVIVFVGLPDSYESEGFDRTHLHMPEGHSALVETALQANPHVTVVVMCGSAVLMPWRGRVEGILMAYLGGQAAGGACADLLTGRVNPSGKLAETFPLSLEETPCFEHFAGDEINVEYREGVLVGYRYYDWAGLEVQYPFGHGLSYTSFSYDHMELCWDESARTGCAQVTVTNTGNCAGSEVVQLYIGKSESGTMRPPRELKGFAKVALKAGETKTVAIPLDERSFAVYSIERHNWILENGVYQVSIAASSRDIRLTGEITVAGVKLEEYIPYTPGRNVQDGRFIAAAEEFEKLFPDGIPREQESQELSVNTPLKKALENPMLHDRLAPMVKALTGAYDQDSDLGKMMMAMLDDMPLRSLAVFSIGTLEEYEQMVATANQSGNAGDDEAKD